MIKTATSPKAPAGEPSDTRLSILRIARELIQTRSYLGLSFQDLADQVGIRKASLYHHFPSKEALGVAVLERSTQQFDQWIAKRAGMPPRQQLSDYIAMFRDTLGAGRRVCPGGAMVAGWDSIEPGLQHAIGHLRERQLAWLSTVIAQIKPASASKDASALAPNPTPAQFAAQTFALCQGALLTARISGRPNDFDEAVAPLMAALQLPPLP
jgi:TetR/AcrR family transcriptional repressor of nem operon